MIIESYALYLVLPCTMLIFSIGYYLGRSQIKHERETVLNALSTMLQSADQLSQDVDSHNTELTEMGRTVTDLEVTAEMGNVRQSLVDHIKGIISSNKKLEDDLVCARYTLQQQSQELDQTRAAVRTDELSQVGNRKAFDEALDYWLSKWNRQGERFTLVICDIDHFKRINDTHGHQAGDGVVRGVGALLQEHIGKDNFVARYGGDEFALLFESEQRQSAIDLAKNIHSAAEEHTFSARHGEQVAITLSMGLACVREGDTAESLFGRADAVLYAAKHGGRNCLRVDVDESREEECEMVTTS